VTRLERGGRHCVVLTVAEALAWYLSIHTVWPIEQNL
jgi:hypothetical protein